MDGNLQNAESITQAIPWYTYPLQPGLVYIFTVASWFQAQASPLTSLGLTLLQGIYWAVH